VEESGLKTDPRKWSPRVTPSPSEPTIVVVDDDGAVRASLKFCLELDGYAVETHASGEALVALGALPLCGCLVLENALPGMSGLQLLRTLRDRDVALPAVLITNKPTRAVRAEAAAAGVPIVEKPLLSNALMTRVQQALAATS
jgi:FixJ family two-component response regulator